MVFEFNPFALDIGFGKSPIRSITISSNVDWFSVPADALTGDNVVFPVNTRSDIGALKVFATGNATGAPSMRLLTSAHIPNIEITQVNGLVAAINSLVKTLASGNSTALSVTNNGVGDYTITPNFGTIANKIAQGNDSRFPASVTGLRKGAGVGSADVAATAKVDYWDTTVFVASGGSHAKGLVPDPGATPGTAKFLREDATWVTPAGSGTVTSVALTMPGEFSVAGSPVTTNGTLAVTKANQNANLVFAGPTTGGAAAPTFRAHVYADISALVGTGASTIAAGNDTRFPASVTGIRKSTGAGSTDVAAVKYTDYWDNSVFGSKGPSHNIGLVPDPGAGTAPYTRYLREDATWQVFTPADASLTNTMLATMASKTLKANATAGTASPTDVTAIVARSSSLLNLESITTFGNTDYTALATDKRVVTSANFTATRTVTLPLANTFNPGQVIEVFDDFGAINGAFVLNIARQGSDTIQGSSSALVMDVPKGGYTLSSDGNNKWSVTKRTPPVKAVYFVSNGTYTPGTGCKAFFAEAVAGGGGGAGAQASASNAAAGAGGGGGSYANVLITSPASSYSVTIGVGGAQGAAANGTGGTGGDTILGSVLTAKGGLGGTCSGGGTTSIVNGVGGLSSSASSIGDILINGSCGGHALRISGTVALAGFGGGSPWGGSIFPPDVSEAVGNGASRYGGGGSGALSYSATGRVGGIGFQGILKITEYY